MKVRQIHRFSILLVLLCLFAWPCKGQKLYLDLTACGNFLTDRRSDMYDFIENHLLNEVNKDSIQNNFGLDILYNMDLAQLYVLKYKDEEKAIHCLEHCKDKLYALKDDKASHDAYKDCLSSLKFYYLNTGKLSKAEEACKEYLLLSISDDLNENIVSTYSILASVYEQEGDSILAYNARREYQLAQVKLYVKNHPKQSAILNQFQVLLQSKKSFEQNNQTDTIDYVYTLIMLGNILKETCGSDIAEPLEHYLKAYKIIQANNFLRYKTPLINSCYENLQEIFIKNAQQPGSPLFIKHITPDLIYLYDGILDESDIYYSFAASYGANGFPQQALDYEKLALRCIDREGKDAKNKKIRIYRSLINDYWDMRNDTSNVAAWTCIRELKSLTHNNNDTLYSECLLKEGIALRYLNKKDEAIDQFKSCLPLFKNKYGETSDLYIDCLNQIALSISVSDTEMAIKYLTEAKNLIKVSNKVKATTIYGVSLNLAKCYIAKSKWQPALDELEIAEQGEKKIFGKAKLSTIQLKEQCIYYLRQGN